MDRSETPNIDQQACADRAENIRDNPKSWIAWKREADRLQSFIKHASNIEIACENPSVKDHMEHWEGRAITAERELTALTAQLAAARRDAERLDWIDTLSSSGLDQIGYGDYRYYVHGKGYPLVREVIDAAMKEPK